MADTAPRRVCVIGLGYVGLPTAASIAAQGVEVIGVDVDAERLSAIGAGAPPTAEGDLRELVRKVVAAGRLRTAATPRPADAFIIAVPTPHGPDHAPDVSFVRAAAESLAPLLRPGNLVVLESTSPVGTTEDLCVWLAESRGDLSFPHAAGEASDVRVAYSPERAIPGNMLHELTNNDRVVGGITAACATAAAGLYQVFVRGRCHTTTARTSELVKLTENAYRDVNIAFANEISLVCDSLGIDPWELIELANRHPRVDILKPGPGVGGHCIAVDPWFIVHSAPERTPLIRAARQVNGSKPLWVAEQVLAACQGIKAPVIACLGLAYKAEVLSAAVPSPGGPTTRGVTYCLATKVTILTHVSPTVFREGPYRFFFFSREEARIHVHVICASGEAKFWLDPAVEPAMSKGISAHESRAIQQIIERRKEEIVRAWRQHFAS